MKRTLFVLLLITFISFVGAQPVPAQTEIANGQVATNLAGVGGACAPLTVNREGIAELVCDVFVAENGATDSFDAGDTIVITFTTNLDLTSPVLPASAAFPSANLAGTGVTLATATFNRVTTAFPVTTVIQITLVITSDTTANNDRIGVRNLRFDVSDFAELTTFVAAVTINGATVFAGSPVDVAFSINTATGTNTPSGVGVQSSGGPLDTQSFENITENFFGTLRAARAANTTTLDIATTATKVNFAVTNIPSGVTVTFPATFTASAVTTESFQLTAATSPLTATGGALAVTYDTTRESTSVTPLDITTEGTAGANRIVVTVGTSSGFGTASIQISFGPNSATTAIPRYAGGANTLSGAGSGRALVQTENFFSITSVATNIIFPWLFNTFGFESAFALSNTGLDDLKAGGLSQATGQTGVISCTMFANDGTTASMTTGALGPGRGLNADGTLSPGGTWAVSLTDVLAAAGVPAGTTKEGYVVCQAQFQFAHATGILIPPNGIFFTAPVIILPSATARTLPEGQ